MRDRFHQWLLIASILWLSWLAMMLVHETGHVLGAVSSGGTVTRMVWRPGVISRTDVWPNPHPLIEIWAGPVFGCLAPLAAALLFSWGRAKIAYLFWAVAGFCLIANGVYIGVGAIKPVGDAAELLRHGMSRWVLAIFGLAALAGGLWIWDRISPRFGFGPAPIPTNARHARHVFVLALLATAAGLVVGNKG